MVRRCTLPLLVAMVSAFAAAQMTISPDRLPEASSGANYYLELQVSGGTAPYAWTIRGDLPEGIAFDKPTATLAGIPGAAGDFRFTVTARDTAGHTASREYVLHVTSGGLEISWTKSPPKVANGGIFGNLEVTNAGREPFDLTFICVAVNENGRATALGYQHFSMGRGKQRIPFGSTLPRGTYTVHADAVAEVGRTRGIQRARLQMNALIVP